MGREPPDPSGTPLLDRLGFKAEFRAAVLNAPPEYRKKLEELGSLAVGEVLPHHSLDFIHFFAVDRSQLETEFPTLKEGLKQTGMLWVSWPKRSSGVKTDLSDRVVREVGLRNGLVDVRVAAVDETWSGLKFVRRLKDKR
jgi:hypothetical protein